MNKPITVFELRALYNEILDSGNDPLLVTNDDCFNIHPRAIRDICFKYDRISFSASFQGHIRDITVFNDDILDITVNGE